MHIALLQFFTDEGTADLAASVHFLRDDLCFIAIFQTGFLKKVRRSFAFISESVILSDYHEGCLQRTDQDLADKLIRFHMSDLLIQRAFQKDIHAHIFEKQSPLFPCEDGLTVGHKSYNYRSCAIFFFVFQNLLDQFPVSAMNSVKFPQRYRTVGKLWKLSFDLDVFHVF